MQNNPQDVYNARIDSFKSQLKTLLDQDRSIVLYRTITFVILGGGAIFIGIRLSVIYGLILGFLCIMVLMFWAKKHSALRFEQRKRRKLIEINEHELQCIAGKWDMYPNGLGYYDQQPEHPYQRDLDLFGDNSLFQYLNRSASQIGSDELAHRLQEPYQLPAEVEAAQAEIQHFTPLIELRQQWQAIGKLTPEKEIPKGIFEYLESPPADTQPNIFKKIFPYIAIVLSLAGFAVGILFSIWSLLGLSFILVTVISTFLSRKQMLEDAEAISFVGDIIKKNYQLLQLVAQADPNQADITSLQKTVTQLQSLSQIANDFNAKSFPVVGLLMNGLFAWDIRCVERLRFWRLENGKSLATMRRLIAKIDYLQSLATYSYNNPACIYPKVIPLSANNLIWKAQNLGHPLIAANKRVSNSFSASSAEGGVSVITGSNMAGKSTFLRTIGVNHVLALMGAPVSASQLEISPLALRTSMRTMDALHKNESLFYAELKRLKEIIDELRNQQPALLLLDEILKGTNSKDKLEGSFAYVKQLVNLPAIALTATHDLELAQLRNEFEKRVGAYYFDFTLAPDDSLKYDYRLKTGTPPAFNATLLMKKMGIIPN